MRKLQAVSTPHDVISGCFGAVGVTTRRNGGDDLPGRPDHFGFSVGLAQYYSLRESFCSRLRSPIQLPYPGGGIATIGQQVPASTLSWCWGSVLPSLALVFSETLGLPEGGGYVAVVVPSFTVGIQWLEGRLVPYTRKSLLYGRPCLRVDLETPSSGVGPGVYRLYLVTQDLYGSLGERPS